MQTHEYDNQKRAITSTKAGRSSKIQDGHGRWAYFYKGVSS